MSLEDVLEKLEDAERERDAARAELAELKEDNEILDELAEEDKAELASLRERLALAEGLIAANDEALSRVYLDTDGSIHTDDWDGLMAAVVNVGVAKAGLDAATAGKGGEEE